VAGDQTTSTSATDAAKSSAGTVRRDARHDEAPLTQASIARF
jgi:hypothetical protein